MDADGAATAVPPLVAGLDLGSTGVKLLVVDGDGAEVLVRQRPTPWRAGPGGTTTMGADDLVDTVHRLLVEAAGELRRRFGAGARVDALAVSGMGESGVLVDPDGTAVTPAIAWFDPRGAEQLAALPGSIVAQFAGRTGLPLGVQVTVIKLLHLRDQGVALHGRCWLNLPELVVRVLGGRAGAEYSLASRTGLLDQDTQQWWPELLDHLGVGPGFLPELVQAGTPMGQADAPGLPAVFAGARLTVAGHDHLVSTMAGGAIPPERYHVSMGTAEVLLRSLPAPLPFDARERLADRLINCVRHVVPGHWVLVAGVKTGLLMRRALELAGISDDADRDRLDARVLALDPAAARSAGAVEVSGARNDDGVLRLTVRADGTGPAEVFQAVLQHGNDEIARLVEAIDAELPPATSALLTGGWARMGSVRRARAEVLPEVSVSTRTQDTAYGAAVLARRLLDHHPPQPVRTDPPGREPMTDLTTMDRRVMSRISTPGGGMLIVAADQRNSMKAVMTDAPGGTSAISADELAQAKSDLVAHLGNAAPAILLDPEVALPGVVDDAVLAPDTGLVVGLDASGYASENGLRRTRRVAGMTPRRVRELGGDAAKMLWYLRADRRGDEASVLAEMRDLVAECEAEGVLLIVEILTYRLEDESEDAYAEVFPSLVAGAAELCIEAGAKVLKLQYPGSAEGCAAVTAAAQGAPWAVLSAGVDHETFVAQVATAVEQGASGAMAGRSLWKDSLSISSETRHELLTTRAVPRLQELQQVIDRALAARS